MKQNLFCRAYIPEEELFINVFNKDGSLNHKIPLEIVRSKTLNKNTKFLLLRVKQQEDFETLEDIDQIKEISYLGTVLSGDLSFYYNEFDKIHNITLQEYDKLSSRKNNVSSLDNNVGFGNYGLNEFSFVLNSRNLNQEFIILDEGYEYSEEEDNLTLNRTVENLSNRRVSINLNGDTIDIDIPSEISIDSILLRERIDSGTNLIFTEIISVDSESNEMILGTLQGDWINTGAQFEMTLTSTYTRPISDTERNNNIDHTYDQYQYELLFNQYNFEVIERLNGNFEELRDNIAIAGEVLTRNPTEVIEAFTAGLAQVVEGLENLTNSAIAAANEIVEINDIFTANSD
jgi:hypothetical protein